jgi:NAD(P)-dependent dehydrogenase (short-subunit alcohol dehydrogenase family)
MNETPVNLSPAAETAAKAVRGYDRLRGRVALVTGGARGIGRGIAEAFVREGAIVGIIDLKQGRVDTAAAALGKAGGTVVGEAGDVSDRAVLERACHGLLDKFGRFDILVNNAMWARYQPLAELTPENLDGMLGVGFKAVVWGMQVAEAIMAPRGGGTVINISSVAAARSLPNSLVYSGIKAGVGGLTRSGAVDLGPKGIRVNAIAPGTTLTDGVARNLAEEAMEHRVSRTPLGRLGQAADMGAAAVYLASDESAWVNGITLFVDGGITAAFL